MNLWDDTCIQPGQEWRTEIEKKLASAKIAILLTSLDFNESVFIQNTELPTILEAARERGLVILWIAVRASSFDRTPLRHYQAVNDPNRPLDSLQKPQREKEWVRIASVIERALTSSAGLMASAQGISG